MFTNKSADIMRLRQEALDAAAVPWRMCSPIQLSVARREGVVVLTHVKPDGDAIGSTIAATRAINLAAGNRRRMRASRPLLGPVPLRAFVID